MDRRKFMSWVGVGFLASSLPVAIAACSSDDVGAGTDSSNSEPPPPPPEAIAREDGFIPFGPSQALETDGYLSGEADGTTVVVAKGPGDTLLAVASKCPHAGCDVAWKSETSLFECPCHGSKFNSDGSVSTGPATSALPIFEAKVEEDVVLVKPV